MPCNWRCKIYCGAGIPHHSYKISIRCSDPFIPFLRSFFWHGSWASLLDMCNANEQSHGCQPLAATAGQQSLWNELPGKKKIIQKPLLVVSLRLLFQNSHQNSLVLSLSSQVPFVPVEARAQQRMEATSRSFPRVDSSLRIFEAPKTPSPHATVQPIEMNASPGNRRIYIYIYILSCYTSNKS